MIMRGIALSLLIASSASGQYWVRPAKTPNVDVVCKGCPDRSANKLTPGFPPSLGTYLGRYLDSSATSDCQQNFRSYRAVTVLPRPERNRIYFQIGSAVFAYDMNRFFQRVSAGEPLSLRNDRSKCLTQIADIALPPDSLYYAEDPNSGWDVSSGGDGQTRLFWFDVDDRGYVYLATKYYGWGIVRDTAANSVMEFVSQIKPDNTEVTPTLVAAARDSAGQYYALVSDKAGGTVVYNTTQPGAMVRVGKFARPVWNFAKNADSTRIAIATPDGRMEIYTTDSFVIGGAPLFTRSDESMIQAVASDGTNFYGAAVKSSALVLSSYVPDGATYRKVVDYSPAPRATISVENLRYGAGYLTAAGFVDGAFELRLFRVGQ